jgi:O-antigen/teichoic acid export membrane protein
MKVDQGVADYSKISIILNDTYGKYKRNKSFLLQFLTGQFLFQFLNLLNGFFLLRWLPIAEQAKFSVAFSIQTLIITLSDLGFTSSIIALTGSRINDKEVIGSYVQSAKRLRNYFFAFSCLITLLLLPYIIKKQAWGYGELFIILVPVLLSVFWQADCSLYDSTLVMHKKMKELYKPQIAISGGKLLTNFILQLSQSIGALTTLIVNAIALFFTSLFFKKQAQPFIKICAETYPDQQKEMFQYIKPILPSLVFNALYGQIQIFLISFFGKTANIAEVAALGRLAQLFIFLGSFNAIVISPVIAKKTHLETRKLYILILGGALFVAGSIYSLSILAPGLFLFLLGPKYFHLENILSMTILSSCVTYVGGVIWTMNSARKWIFWWSSVLYIVSILCCQIIAIMYFDLSKTSGVILLSLLTAIIILMVQISISVTGFIKHKEG